jgi:23S rRNA-/tRNA-specific pseudouridylate synthase
MIVHHLDMDTSSIVIFARDRVSMSMLHGAFRYRTGTGTNKAYEVLLEGWLDID